MRIAILITNTDESAFAQAHPKDGAKFTALIHRVRPDWICDVYAVKDGIFPEPFDFDGILITGSPASVHDPAPWIARLETLVRDAVARRVPLFGACFGHQIIAKALGAPVGDNPSGWVLGRVTTMLSDTDTPVSVYAAHKEQVMALPPQARVAAHTDGCAIAGFAIADHVLTTQYHPEMTHGFIAALLDAFAGDIGPDITRSAAATLTPAPDQTGWAERIAGFFETAAS